MRKIEAKTPRGLYKKIIRKALEGELQPQSRTLFLHSKSLHQTLNLNDVGFNPKRWTDYLEHYFEGGLILEQFLESLNFDRLKKGAVETGITTNYTLGKHAHGPCLLGLSVSRDAVTLYSRAVNWVPTGFLDLLVACLVGERIEAAMNTKMQLKWFISQLDIQPFKAVPLCIKLGMNIDHNTMFAKACKRFVCEDKEYKYQQMRAAKNRLTNPKKRDTSGLFDSFLHITPDDLAVLCGRRGPTIREFMRQSLGTRNLLEAEGIAYAWTSFEHPVVRAVLEKFGGEPIAMDKVVRRRLARKSQ